MDKHRKIDTITIRLSPQIRELLDRATSMGPYRISITSVVERGIELAVQELERINAACGGRD